MRGVQSYDFNLKKKLCIIVLYKEYWLNVKYGLNGYSLLDIKI